MTREDNELIARKVMRVSNCLFRQINGMRERPTAVYLNSSLDAKGYLRIIVEGVKRDLSNTKFGEIPINPERERRQGDYDFDITPYLR